MNNNNQYYIENNNTIETPSLIYHRDIIEDNIKKSIDIAGDAKRLWPHVKTHKTRELIMMQKDLGIERFKCATIAEAEMLATVGAKHVLVAYPLIGPNIMRFVRLQQTFGKTQFWAIVDDFEQLTQLATCASAEGLTIPLLIDVNYGMNRTGVPLGPEIENIFHQARLLKGVEMLGFHCYDGHHTDFDLTRRMERVNQQNKVMFSIAESIVSKMDNFKPIFVMGGTPSFPCHAKTPGLFLSPGTAFVYDYGYSKKVPDLPFVPGATILTRVISHPTPHHFTLDLGHKGIAADPTGQRGLIVGMEDAKPLGHSEEHWVFSRATNYTIPPIGSLWHVIPTHICPTSALYPWVFVAQKGEIIGRWNIAARNRHLCF